MLLNLADDHLEWHGSFAAYAEAKTRDLARSAGRDRGRQRWTIRGSPPGWRGCPGRPVGVHARPRRARAARAWSTGCWWTGRSADRPVELLPVAEVRPAGRHNVANALAAAALARALRGAAGGGRAPAWPATGPSRTATPWSPRWRAWPMWTTARRPTRTPRSLRCWRIRGWCGWPVASSRASTSPSWCARSPPRWPVRCCSGVDRAAIAAALARHAPAGARW